MTTGEVIALIKAFGGGGGGSSGGGVLVVHDVEGKLDKTWKQISDAIENGTIPYMIVDNNGDKSVYILSSFFTYENHGVTFYAVEFGQNGLYETDSENGYPSTGGGGSI